MRCAKLQASALLGSNCILLLVMLAFSFSRFVTQIGVNEIISGFLSTLQVAVLCARRFNSLSPCQYMSTDGALQVGSFVFSFSLAIRSDI